MKVLAHVGAGCRERREHSVPAIGPGEMWRRVRGCGPCGSGIAEREPGDPLWAVGHQAAKV
jgi:hypothetical protein